MKRIGPGFFKELQDAGLAGLPFSWTESGVAFSPEMTAAQISTVEAVLAAHNPEATDPEAEKNATDAGAARSYGKLAALRGMTPAEVQAWVAANVTTLAQARDAITTLAIGVSVLARRI